MNASLIVETRETDVYFKKRKIMLVNPISILIQVITSEEAERRGKIYDANGRTYLFDLDYNDDDCPFTVDAGHYGNISHFVNHSVSCQTRSSGWFLSFEIRFMTHPFWICIAFV